MPKRSSDSDSSYHSRSRRKNTSKRSRKSDSSPSSARSDRSLSCDRKKPARYRTSHSSSSKSKDHNRRPPRRRSGSSNSSRSSHRRHSDKSSSKTTSSSSKSKSKSHRRSRSSSSSASPNKKHTSHRSRSYSNSNSHRSSTKSRKRSKSKSPSRSSANKPKVEHFIKTLSEEDRMKEKLQAALKAAANADAALREKGLLAGGSAAPTAVDKNQDDVVIQIKRAQAIEDINSESFTQQEFTSSRKWGKNEDDILLLAETSKSSTISPATTMNDDWKTNPELLAHPNLSEDPDLRMERWKKKLTDLRRKQCNGTLLVEK